MRPSHPFPTTTRGNASATRCTGCGDLFDYVSGRILCLPCKRERGIDTFPESFTDRIHDSDNAPDLTDVFGPNGWDYVGS